MTVNLKSRVSSVPDIVGIKMGKNKSSINTVNAVNVLVILYEKAVNSKLSHLWEWY